MRGQACEACGLLGPEAAELGQEGDEAAGGDGADAWDGAEGLFVAGQVWNGLDEVGHVLVDAVDLSCQEGDLFVEQGLQALAAAWG